MKNSHENSKDFLASIFLTCPECDGKAYIEKLGEDADGKFDHFIVVCQCTKWKIGFHISETE